MTLTAGGKLAVVTALTALVSAGSIWTISLWGFGTSPDSMLYISGARSLAAGAGFLLPSNDGAAPMAQYPPLFSALLAAFSLIDVDPLDGAAILNATLLALNVCLAAALVYHATRIPLAGFVAALLTLSAPTVLTTHTMVWSEPLFLFLLLLTALAIFCYQEKPSYTALLPILLPAALAPLARYAGVAVLGAAAWQIARKNIKHAAGFSIFAGVGIAAWLARSYRFVSNTGYHSVGFHPPSFDQLQLGWITVVEWAGGPLLFVAAAGLLAITIMRRAPHGKSSSGANFLPTFAIAYMLLLGLIISFVTVQIPLDRRILSPLYLALSLWAVIKITAIAQRPLRFGWTGAALLIVMVNSWTSIEWLRTLSTQGFGYSAAIWRFSPTMKYLQAHQPKPLHTNAPDPVFLLTGTPAAMLPRHTDPGTMAQNRDYARQISELKKGGGTVVYFRAVNWRWYLPDEARLKTELGLRPIADLGDGAVYAIEPPVIAHTAR